MPTPNPAKPLVILPIEATRVTTTTVLMDKLPATPAPPIIAPLLAYPGASASLATAGPTPMTRTSLAIPVLEALQLAAPAALPAPEARRRHAIIILILVHSILTTIPA